MDYLYSQNYGLYANYGIGDPTMAQKGCVITCLAMILSYFNGSAYTPEKMLSWGRKFGMIDVRGNTNFAKFPEATGNKLRISTTPNANSGEKVYAIREVLFSNKLPHWVIDDPNVPNMIIDPWDGRRKPYSSQNYTGRVYYYIGKK